jgi:hypothetical protein
MVAIVATLEHVETLDDEGADHSPSLVAESTTIFDRHTVG